MFVIIICFEVFGFRVFYLSFNVYLRSGEELGNEDLIDDLEKIDEVLKY